VSETDAQDNVLDPSVCKNCPDEPAVPGQLYDTLLKIVVVASTILVTILVTAVMLRVLRFRFDSASISPAT
jgi:hypothetical protein